MKIKLKLSFFYLLTVILIFLLDSSLQAKSPRNSPLYFTVNIKEYEVQPGPSHGPQKMTIRLHIADQTINLVYDRPSTKVKKVHISDFLTYLKRPDKKDLSLSLMVGGAPHQPPHPLDFKVLHTSFSPQTDMLEFIAEPVESPGLTLIKPKLDNHEILKGGDSVLFLDG